MPSLPGWSESPFTHDDITLPVYRTGEGPGVLVFPELPGITPAVLSFAERVVDLGCTVVVPSCYGQPGRPVSRGYLARSFVEACVSRRFAAFALGDTAPLIAWSRALAHALHDEVGGPGVGVVGMCFTGGFALAMATDEVVQAPVLSQPSLPLPAGRRRTKALPLSDADLAAVLARADRCPMLGLRFTGDPYVGDRFQTLRRTLGDRFIAVELPSSTGNPAGPKPVHSVLTEHLIDEPGQPTREALDRVLAFLRERLALA